MKILIITMDIGKTAPGIVFERIIRGLSEFHRLDVITSESSPSEELTKVSRLFEVKKVDADPRIEKLFISIFGVNPLDLFWSNKAMSSLVINSDHEYDLVLSLICFRNYAPLLAGNKIANKFQIKHIVYSVDALPAPTGWMKNDAYYKGIKRLVAKNFSKIDGLFSANQKMLDYQLKMFKSKKKLITEVIYNPSYGELQTYKDYEGTQKNVFMFTGGLYGPRTPKYVLGAFKKILQKYPDSYLEFVGSKLPEHCLSIFSQSELKKVIVHPFTKNLAPFYDRATALIDIDADLPDDIFLSSKITNYITVNRIIISETGENSPSQNIFKGISSILQCGHNVDELESAMLQAIKSKGKIDFNDRKDVIKNFSLDSVIKRINSKISV